MQKGTIYFIIGIAIIVIILGIGLCLLDTGTQTPKSISQYCGYVLLIYTSNSGAGDTQTNSSLNSIRNITLLIPLPHRNGEPLVMDQKLTSELFRQYSIETIKGNATSSFESTPPLDYVIISGNGTPMVQIKGDPGTTISSFRMEFKESRKVEDGTSLSELQRTLNTLMPLGNSSVFPLEEQCTSGSVSSCSYSMPVFVSFDTNSNTSLTIYSVIGCRNEWWHGSSWTGNSYGDHYRLDVKGSAHGWYSASGTLTGGEGIYK